MSFYTFRLDQFRIDNTRAGDEDTDVVAFNLNIGGEFFALSQQTGNVDNGNHDVGLEFPGIQIDDQNAVITLKDAIVNAGNNPGAVLAILTGGALDGMNMGVPPTEGGMPPQAFPGAMTLVDGLLVGQLGGCDGTVAADTLAAERFRFDQLIPDGGRTTTHTKFYPGSNSGFLCGSNSQYKVTRTIIRTEAGDVNQPDMTKAFIILSRSSGLVLDVPGFSNDAQTPIQQFPDNGGQNQHWQLVPVDGRFFQVRSLSSGLVLDVRGASRDDHAVIQQFPDNGGQNQHWEFIPVFVGPPDLPFPVLGGGTTFFKIRCRRSGKVLDVTGRSAEPQVQLQQAGDSGGSNQLWQLLSVGDL
jgi:hypothetical protein